MPVSITLYPSLIDSSTGNISLINFHLFFSDSLMVEILLNSVWVALLVVLGTLCLGIPSAYVLNRYSFRGKGWFQVLIALPLVLPPFVGALGFLRFFGRGGVINLLSFHLTGSRLIDLQSLYGVAFVQIMHLFPIVYLNVLNALSNIDPSLEESASNLGASRRTVFRTITLPLSAPGVMAGSLIVFMWSLSDLGTPLFLLGSSARLLAPQAFLLFQSLATHIFASVSSMVMLAIAVVTIVIARRYVSLKQYTTLSSGLPPPALTKRMSRYLEKAVIAILIALSAFGLLPHVGIALGSLSEVWSFSYFPQKFTLGNYGRVLSEGSHYLVNTFLYTGLSTTIDIILGLVIAYILARRAYRGSLLLDGLATIPLTVPGVVLGFGYFLLFKDFLRPGSPFVFTLIVIALAYAVRRLPYTVRSNYAVLQQIPTSLEEASTNLGAGQVFTIKKITLPLIRNGVVAGGLMAFVNAVVELSSTIFIINNVNHAPATLGMLIYKESGVQGEGPADALGLLMIVVVGVSIALSNRLLRGGAGSLFRLG